MNTMSECPSVSEEVGGPVPRAAYEMVVTMWTKLVRLLKRRHVFPERFLALLAQECHLGSLCQRVIFLFGVTFRTL